MQLTLFVSTDRLVHAFFSSHKISDLPLQDSRYSLKTLITDGPSLFKRAKIFQVGRFTFGIFPPLLDRMKVR